jgi:hypothetical protein
MKTIEEILAQYAGDFKYCPAAVTLFDRLQQQKGSYGNPTFTPLGEAFDVTWGAGNSKIALRWTWLDSAHIRKDDDDSASLLGCGLVWNYEEHLVLKEENIPWLYVNASLTDYPGKIRPQPYPNEIVTCKTQEGIWLKETLKEGLDFLSIH